MICVEDVPVTLLIPQKLHDQVCIQHEGSALTNVNSSQLAEEALFSGLNQHLLIVIPARSPGETENRELLLSCRYLHSFANMQLVLAMATDAPLQSSKLSHARLLLVQALLTGFLTLELRSPVTH